MEFGDTADWKSALRIWLLDPAKTEALRAVENDRLEDLTRHRTATNLAEREGFEPTVLLRYSRFPGVRFKPLSHLSA